MNLTITYQNGTGAGSGRVRVGHNSSVQNPDAVWSFTLTELTTSLTFNLTWDNEAAGTGWRGAYDYAFAISSVGTANKQLAKGSNNIAKVVPKLSGVKGSAVVKFDKTLTSGTYYLRANFNGSTLSTMKAFSTTVTGTSVGEEGSVGGAVYARKIYIEKSIKKDENDNTVDRLLMCGYGGMLQRSNDGTSWTAINTGATQNYFGVNFLGARYIAVGTNGRVSVSTDMGTTWAHTSLSDQDFENVAYGGGLWVISGGNEIWASNDASNWVLVLKDSGKSHHFEGVIWDGEKFIAYGLYDNLGNDRRLGGFYFSNDGYSWDWLNWSGENVYSYVIDMIKAEGFIYAAGWIDDPRTCAILRSKNGYNWEVAHYFNNEYGYIGITYGNGRLLAHGYNGTISYSDDGVNWADTTYLSNTIWDAAGYGFGKFVIGGREGTTYKRAYSSDGITWSGLVTNLPYAPTDFCFGLSKYHYDIRQACLDELLKRKVIQKVEGEVENTLPPRYGVDYNLGDIVEINAAGYQGRQRITKVRHVLEPNRVSITPVIGDDFLDLRQFIAREVNK